MEPAETALLHNILHAYHLDIATCCITPFGTGLINRTWKISAGQDYILQQVNVAVFKNPVAIAQNIRRLGTHFSKYHPQYLFVQNKQTSTGDDLVLGPDNKYYRLFPFVPFSHSVDVVNTPAQAFEAATQFGKFTRLSSGFNPATLHETLPHFHNLSLRFQQFSEALISGNPERIGEAAESVAQLKQYKYLVDHYEDLKKLPHFRLRVTHHDTKISNVLLDESGNGLCVIDLDTVMPGYFISDVGDMMRTCLSPVSEEERDPERIQIRPDYFEAIVSGYLKEMKEELTETEKAQFVYAGKFMVYMQALRFLTDYLNNDSYYGCTYATQNLVRARNQLTLLQRLCDCETSLQERVTNALSTSRFIV